MPQLPEVYAICSASEIEKGDAKAFSLSRITEAGEARPFPLVVVRTHRDEFFGYVNVCPHKGSWLNFGDGSFFSRERAFLQCGRHGALFEIDSGLCIAGDCRGEGLEPVAVAIIGGDLCICGVPLVEDEERNAFIDVDETMDIMIHPD